jgi:hypothetical protein
MFQGASSIIMKAFKLWLPLENTFAWMPVIGPVYDSKLALDRQRQVFACHAAPRVRLERQALAHISKNWDVRIANFLHEFRA